MNTTCKYCGKSLPREYAPGERSEFCTVVSGGKNKKDGSASSDRVMHFCSESCAKWKTYKDKVARAVGIGKSKRLSEAEISDMIDNLVKPDGVDPMAAETTEKPVQRPTEEPNNVPAEEEKPVETPAEAVKHAEEAKPMETPKKKRMVVMCREISMSGNHVEATLNAANATIKSLYIASEPETIDDLQACIEELTEVLDMMMKEAANGNA